MQTNKKLHLHLAKRHVETYHKIPAPLTLLTYSHAMEVHVDVTHARSAKVMHFNTPVNLLFPCMGNGRPLKSATSQDTVWQEEELLYPMALADPL